MLRWTGGLVMSTELVVLILLLLAIVVLDFIGSVLTSRRRYTFD